jgi:hypothetical protein
MFIKDRPSGKPTCAEDSEERPLHAEAASEGQQKRQGSEHNEQQTEVANARDPTTQAQIEM